MSIIDKVKEWNSKLDKNRQFMSDAIEKISKTKGAILQGNGFINMAAYISITNDKNVIITKKRYISLMEQLLNNYDDLFKVRIVEINNYKKGDNNNLIIIPVEEFDNKNVNDAIEESNRILLYNRQNTFIKSVDEKKYYHSIKGLEKPIFVIMDDSGIIEKNVYFDSKRILSYLGINVNEQEAFLYGIDNIKKLVESLKIRTGKRPAFKETVKWVETVDDRINTLFIEQFNNLHNHTFNKIIKSINFKNLEDFQLKGLDSCEYDRDERNSSLTIEELIKRGECVDIATVLDRCIDLLELYSYYPRAAINQFLIEFPSEKDFYNDGLNNAPPQTEKLKQLLKTLSEEKKDPITCVIIPDHKAFHTSLIQDIKTLNKDNVILLNRMDNAKILTNTIKKRLIDAKNTIFIISEKQFRLEVEDDFLRFNKVYIFSYLYAYSYGELMKLPGHLIEEKKDSIIVFNGNNKIDNELFSIIGNRKQNMDKYYDEWIWNSYIDYDDLLLIDMFILDDGKIREPSFSAFRDYSIRNLTPYEKYAILEGDYNNDIFEIGVSLTSIIKGTKNLLGKININKLSKRAIELLRKIDFKKLTKKGTILLETFTKLTIKDFNVPELVLLVASDKKDEALFKLAQRLPKSSGTIKKTGLSTFEFAKALIGEADIIVKDIAEKEGKEFIEEIKKEEQKEIEKKKKDEEEIKKEEEKKKVEEDTNKIKGCIHFPKRVLRNSDHHFIGAVIGDEIEFKLENDNSMNNGIIVDKDDDEDGHMIWIIKSNNDHNLHDIYDDNYDHFKITKKLTAQGAQKILELGSIHGRRLSMKEKRYLTLVAYSDKRLKRNRIMKYGKRKSRCRKCKK